MSQPEEFLLTKVKKQHKKLCLSREAKKKGNKLENDEIALHEVPNLGKPNKRIQNNDDGPKKKSK